MFKEDFVWGAATSAYQIEGAAFEDGKGLSIWDTYCMEKNKIFGSHTGNIACDHYHKYRDDIKLMKTMGIKAYRFSLSWPRILPNGIGEINEKGIEFYNNLIDALIENGIEPYITLFHWDYPRELYKMGGWLNPDSPKWFAEYAQLAVERFSDRVKNFITFNEPQCFIGFGYCTGGLAPGFQLPMHDTVPMAHNVLLAHGMAVKIMRKYAKSEIKIGYAPTYTFPYPASESKEDIDAARTATFEYTEEMFEGDWSWSESWWCDPVFLGKYPEDALHYLKKYLPVGWENDLETIGQPLDFMGQNLYNGWECRCGADGKPEGVEREVGYPQTASEWPITPEALKWGVKFLYERYKLPIYITENGIGCYDVISLDNQVHDPLRIDFLNRYLLKLREAIDEGADVAGYFQWSLMDNFEWCQGYRKRFGLIYVDYETQKRIIKDSGYWYRKIIENNGENL